MKTKDILIIGFAVVLLAVLGYVWFAPTGLQRAPDIALKTLDGKTVRLADLRGRPVLVNFWATTCPGCVAEMPQLAALYRDLGPRGLTVIGIAMSDDPPNQVVTLTHERNIPYTIALDTDGKASQAFGNIQLTPTSFLIAPDGRIVRQKIGELNFPRVRDEILAMLPATASAGGTARLAAAP